MARVGSPSAISMSALGTFKNATVFGLSSGLRSGFLLVVGGGIVAVAGVLALRLRLADWLFRPLHAQQRERGARADKKAARWKTQELNCLATKTNGPSRRSSKKIQGAWR